MRPSINISTAVLALSVALLAQAATAATTTFYLQGVRSRAKFGPFTFKTGASVKVESGLFKLNLVGDRSFRLISSDTGKTYGVYELVPGRMIDVGDVLFTITNIKTRKSPADGVPVRALGPAAARPSFLDGMTLGLELELLNTVPYKWEIDGAEGDSEEDMERTSATLLFQKSFLTASLGLVTSAEWDNTIAGDGSTFENATVEEGRGWIVGVGVDVPVFGEGRWKGSVFGEASYRQEALSLQYGAWEIESIVSTTVTNGASNVVTTTTNLDYVNHDKDATLTEVLVMVGADIVYQAPHWFIYAGLKALPWADTSLDATIVAGSNKFEIEFERKDPVMGYGGVGFIVAGTKCYVEAEGGGETAVRLGLLKEW